MLIASLLSLALVQSILTGSSLQHVATETGDVSSPCQPDAETLCLLANRIRVRVHYRDQHHDGRTGVGRPVALSDKSALFWFFTRDNLELVVKMLDGRELNRAVWFFLGALSDVEFWVEVTDTATGETNTYYNPPGNTFGIADTEAFPSDGAGQACGGGDRVLCPDRLFCDLVPGSCGQPDAAGICVEPRDGCPEIYQPVCGCDGVTYSNDCERIAAGANKRHDGECSSIDFCGGIAGFPCPSDDYLCDPDPGMCYVSDVAGQCVLRPEVCPDIYDPVCGCDGVTYSNDCERLRAGAPLDHPGECPQACGGVDDLACPDALFCDREPGRCGQQEAPGSCVEQSPVCTLEYDPVCGCDGTTYGNDCQRIAAGVGKDHDGECETAP